MEMLERTESCAPSCGRADAWTAALAAALYLCLTAIFAFLAGYGILFTSVIDPNRYVQEHILFASDSFAAGLIALFAAVGMPVLLERLFPRTLRRIGLRLPTAAVLLMTAVAGAVWVIGAASVPAADSGTVTKAGAAVLSGDFRFLTSDDYFTAYPFQLGYVTLSALLQRITGAGNYVGLALFNVLFLVIAYGALLALAWESFHSRRVQLILLALIAACIQPLLFCSFLYGILAGLAAALWAMYLAVRSWRKPSIRTLAGAVVLCLIAVLIKPNYWIAATAVCIFLLISALHAHPWRRLTAAVLIVTLPVAGVCLVQRAYENAAGTRLGAGTPQSAWLVMEFSESERAAGWYNRYAREALEKADYDTAAAKVQIREDLAQRLAEFRADPTYAGTFFFEKMVSQWNETSFESVWISRVKEHITEPSALVTAAYESEALTDYMDDYTQCVYAFFAIGLFALGTGALRKRRFAPGAFLLCLTIFGGFLYHMLFEAKSQYLLIYLIMMLPVAAFGLGTITRLLQPAGRVKAAWKGSGV